MQPEEVEVELCVCVLLESLYTYPLPVIKAAGVLLRDTSTTALLYDERKGIDRRSRFYNVSNANPQSLRVYRYYTHIYHAETSMVQGFFFVRDLISDEADSVVVHSNLLMRELYHYIYADR